ncbi:MAG: radical SAM protein, partial [Rhodoferax sp.]|nr:radical SAM protein [Rhodoferax sp.]
MHAADACNLRCSSCGHYANSGHSGIIEVKEAVEWMKPWMPRLSPNRFKITGGEPTLNPNLVALLQACAEAFPQAQMELVTNGYFLHRHPDLGKVLGQLKCTVVLSSHAPGDAPGRQLLEDWSKQYSFQVAPCESWSGWVRLYHGDGVGMLPFQDANPSQSWHKCRGYQCKQLFRGKLWKCGRVAYLQLQKEKHPGLSSLWDSYLA